MDTPWVEPDYPARSGGTSYGSLRTPAGSSQLVTGAAFAVRTPPQHSAGKDPANEDDEDDDDDDDDDPLGFCIQHHQWDDWQQDEIGMSQLGGAPLGTQGASQVVTKGSLFKYVGSMN
jgi:hypothetical protein